MTNTFAELNHVKRDLPDGGMVFVLDTGAVIDQEAEAMIQSLHSRSTGGVMSHLEVLAKRGAEKFMASFYVGYGHKSIGDCGTATVFIEGVSMLAAKAIQDWPLYSGQEASTRYIDFSEQAFINPNKSALGEEILETWREFYLQAQGPMQDYLCERFPRSLDEKESTYEKAIAARAFDTLRGFLPSGASTNLAWHSNLRQLADKLMYLRHHPLLEVQQIATALEDALKEAFPSSFGHKLYEATEAYNKHLMAEYNYFEKEECVDFELSWNGVNKEILSEYTSALTKRPYKTELPKALAEAGVVQFDFSLDFGSFRDVQRHRAVTQRMPLVTMDHGFMEWYLDELPEDLRTVAIALLETQKEKLETMQLPKELKQYYIPMGYKLPNRLTGDLASIVYLVELRATRFVHPTLRERARQMAAALEYEFGDSGLKIHLDPEADRFDVKRGEHDIVLKD